MATPLTWERRMISLSKFNRSLQQLNVISDLVYTLSRSAVSLSAIAVGYGHDRAERREWDRTRDEVLHPDAIGDLVARNMAANAKVIFKSTEPDDNPTEDI